MGEHLHCLGCEVEYLGCPVEAYEDRAYATCREEYPIEESVVPVLGDWALLDFLHLAELLEPVAYTGDGEDTCELHNPPDENLYGEQGVAYH